jgi:hypothetical protein
MKQGNLKRLVYKSHGQQLQQDIIAAIVEVDGEEYTHPVPNVGWGYQTASLQLLGYLGVKPTDFNGGSVSVDCTVPVDWSEEHGEYLIDDKIFMQGVQALSDASWFNEEGTVWNSGVNQGFGGMNIEPGTGNQAAVEITADGEDD